MRALTLLGAALAYSAIASARVRPRGVNPFEGRVQFGNPQYVDRVGISAQIFEQQGETELYKKAIQIQRNNPTWTWIDTIHKVPKVTEQIKMVRYSGKELIATFVIYNLPDRDCGSTKPLSEYSVAASGEARYREFIDKIKEGIEGINGVPVAIIIEPGAIANLIIHKDIPKCAAADPVQRRLIAYALETLDLSNVVMYIDGGDSWTLGSNDILPIAAKAFADLYIAAGSPANVRGLSVNVGGYNPWAIESCNNATAANCDERSYINSLARLLANNAWSDAHFIIDQSRSGVARSPDANKDFYCNIAGTGFGITPGSSTNDPLADSFVWVNPGGESDGTSDINSPTYNPNCDTEVAIRPSPERGAWFIPLFRQLIENANPPIVPTWST